ncbi:MAG: 4Fe-4S binding protein [Chloroflexi bacterium]|nr:4Fe-4S binding protein [Chloroflexota bacterium]MCL5075431.1 4Fe-4S binding protein [Chloroflexota bacterium]
MTVHMASERLTGRLKEMALEKGADLVGIAPVERFVYAPEGRHPTDHLPNARSVIVLSKHIPDAVIERWGKPPAYSIGQYRVFGHNMINIRLALIQQDLTSYLEELGYLAYPVHPTGARAGLYDGIRQYRADFSNRHAAVAAGLGEFGWSSIVLTPQYGPRQRFTSIITDASLAPDPMYAGPALCTQCLACAKVCPMQAISAEAVVSCEIEGRVFEYAKVDHWRCHWCEVAGLRGEGGPRYMGFTTDVDPPAVVTPESVLKAAKRIDPWQTHAHESLGVAWCGKCLHRCTVGKKLFRRRLEERRQRRVQEYDLQSPSGRA